MSEKTMRRRVLNALKSLDAYPVENHIRPGTPDVNYCEGWLELKWFKSWPKNADSGPVVVRHYTAQQRIWLARRAQAGGRVFLLLQVGKEWLLFDGAWAASYFGKVTRAGLIEAAVAYWGNGLKNEELVKCLRSV